MTYAAPRAYQLVPNVRVGRPASISDLSVDEPMRWRGNVQG